MKCSNLEGGGGREREGRKRGGATVNAWGLSRQIDLRRGSANGTGVGISGALRPKVVLQSPAQLNQYRKLDGFFVLKLTGKISLALLLRSYERPIRPWPDPLIPA